MADKGAELQNYNNELVRCIEELKEKREELHRVIFKEEEEKEKLIGEIRILNERLSRVEDNLVKKYASRTEYDKTIKETEAAYLKILESSQTLLQVLKRETVNLVKKRTGPQTYS